MRSTKLSRQTKVLCMSLLVLWIAVDVKVVRAQNQTVYYTASSENFSNPERGFYKPRTGLDPARNTTGLTLSDLQTIHGAGYTLVRVYYVLSEFRDSSISQAFLDRLTGDFGEARQAGVKLIVRFAYEWNSSDRRDATVDRVLSHLDQLKPVLRANADVLAFLEAGFVGRYGEWHDSTNNLVEPTTWAVNANSRAIIDRILATLPSNRTMALRYPRNKQQYTASTSPVTSSEAFSGSNPSRIGHHNDCLFAGPTDFGTYDRGDIEAYKTYLAQENLYVPQGGETCNAGDGTDANGNYNSYTDSRPYRNCDNAVTELERLHYQTLNIDFEPTVIGDWGQNGCLETIKRRLGYRFQLTEASIPMQVQAGGTLSMVFDINNSGFAAPFNPRAVEVILRNQKTGAKHVVALPDDPRRWSPGMTTRVYVNSPLPSTLAVGTYDLLLNLPDPASSLRSRPEYSIRLANGDVWEQSTGYNRFLRSVEVTSGTGSSVEVIVDNGGSGFSTTGSWEASTSTPGYYGSNYLHDGGPYGSTDTATWTPTITSPGNYDVYMRWTAHPNRPDVAPVEVRHSGGIANQTINQQINGGTWVKIGRWYFNSGTGGSVLLRATDDGYTIADAVRFVKAP